MRALVVSDMHFGAWTGDHVLSHRYALDALAPALDDIDELVLLGDLFDFLFSTVEHAFASAEPFFALLEEKLGGKRLVFLAGNHDHHVMVRELRTFVELKVATGDEAMLRDALAAQPGFLARFLRRRLPEVDSHISYPVHRVGDVLCFHGHYLDAHMSGSLPDRLLNRGVWTFAGGRREGELGIEDYEAVIVPLTEMLFTLAQMPRGTAAQQAAFARFQRIGRLLAFANRPRAGAGAAVAPPGRAGPRARRRPDARRGRRAGLGAGPQRQRRRPALARPPSLLGGRAARSRSHGCSSCWPTSTRCGEPPRRRTSACRSARRATGWRPIPRARDGRRTRCAARR